MLKRLDFEHMELPSLEYVTQAGGKLGKEMSEFFVSICLKKGIKFYVMYGQTEATARISYLPWELAKEKAGSVGIAIPGGELYLKDDEGNVIQDPNVSGELVYKGDNVTLGYAENCSDLSKEDDNEGVLHTGDIAERDSDGLYYIVGRSKRFLKIAGKRINLDEAEFHLKKDDCDCACLGSDDNLVVYITNKNEETEIRKILIKKLGISSQTFDIRFIEKIPRNESNKVQYSMLK